MRHRHATPACAIGMRRRHAPSACDAGMRHRHATPACTVDGDNRRRWVESDVEAVRIDKWLWAGRFFKTRALASRACELGRIESGSVRAKPARDVKPGDRLRIENDGGLYEVDVLAVSEVRGPAAAAQTLYKETEASREARMKLAEELRTMRQMMPVPEHRPSKRDRRRIIQFRGRA
jgi:ribosome-associated heat shock protein Hsp15